MTQPMSADVVIVGGGLVGLTLALWWSQVQPNHRLVILEAHAFPPPPTGQVPPQVGSFDARNTALSRRTVQLFEDLGLWSQLQPHATPIHQIHVSDRGQFGFARLLASEEQVESFGQVVENAWLGVVLLAAVRARSAIQLWDHVTVTDLQSAPDQARVTFTRQGATETLQAPLVVAADGADSTARTWLSLAESRRDYGQTALVTTVSTSLPHAQVAFERFAPDGPIALLPLPDGPGVPSGCRRSLVWALAPEQAAALQAAEEPDFLAALQQAFGKRAGRFLRAGKRWAYTVSLRVAEGQQRPRAVLLGNAAHTLHPVAGQGYNLCVRDVLVLVEQLAQTSDWGDAARLRRYEQERQADQRQIIRFSDALVRGFSVSAAPWVMLRNLGLTAFDVLPGAKPALARYAMGLDHV